MTADTEAKAQRFTEELQGLLDATMPEYGEGNANDRRVRCRSTERNNHFAIHPGAGFRTKGVPLPLLKDGERVANLRISYLCTDDRSGKHLSVHRSSFELVGNGSGVNKTPFIRLDYVNEPNRCPSGHWNVHGENGAVSHLLARTNPRHIGRLDQLHLPVGGQRCRPCLEDFLQMLFDEFRFDKCSGAMAAIEQGRERWRRKQLAAFVRDAPGEAVTELRRMGYLVTPPSEQPDASKDRLRRF